ncbi:MAG: type II toxin-antitoxin system PemK/MazF family toxin [Caldilineaceae bacterium]
MEIKQGDLYWLQATGPDGSVASYAHPYVVIQDDVINRSRVNTVVVCALTSNPKRATEPGNVLLEAGEGNLPKPSVVVVSQVEAVAKTQLGEYIGTVSPQRIAQILAGMRFQQLSFFGRDHTRT